MQSPSEIREEECKPLNSAEFQIDGINMDAAMQYYSGDEDGFIELLEIYCMDGKRKIPLLYELVESDILRYQIEVHGLKSASANIGALGVSAMAREQENAAAQGDRELIGQKFPLLMAEYETLLANIGQFLEQRRRKNDKKEKLPCLSAQELRQQTAAALEELKHFWSQECEERVEALLTHELPEDVSERLLQIQEQLKLLSELLSILDKEEEHK